MTGSERGGFVLGLVLGLLLGLALALGVALYITKAPIPFIDKVPQRTAEQDSAETERNRNWDPNGGLGGRGAPRAAAPPAADPGELPPGITPVPEFQFPAAAAPQASAPLPGARSPAAILSGTDGLPPSPRVAAAAAEPFVYFVQAGAYTRNEDAEQQRARLALIGQSARLTEREQAGRTVYRVRLGPYQTRDEAVAVQGSLQDQSIEAQIVRVERP